MPNAVLFEKQGAVATITLNRPDQLNAMNLDLIDGLAVAMEKAGDPAVRVVVLKGNGRCFCAGGDIRLFNEFLDQGRSLVKEMPDHLHEMVEKLRCLGKPVLASVHGAAAGAGAPLALACDLVIASNDAVFNFAYVRIGLSPDGSSTFFLPRHVGMKKAAELFMTMPTLKAQEALEMGLVNWVVPASDLATRTEEIAAQLAQGPAKVYARAKRLLNASYDNTLHDQLALESDLICESSKDEDFMEGIKSFLSKKPPQFQGK